MSAWIVWPHHISYLVAGALELAPDGFITFGKGKLLTPHTKDAVGQLLMDENVRSVQYRYDRDTFEDLPGPVDKSGIRDYRHIELDVDVRPDRPAQADRLLRVPVLRVPGLAGDGRVQLLQVVRALGRGSAPACPAATGAQPWASTPQLIPAYRNTDAYEDAPWGISPGYREDREAA